MDISIVETYEGFSSLKEEWNHLLKRSSFPHPQLTWEWFDIAWRHLKPRGHLAVFCALEGERAIGFAPMMVLQESAFLRSIIKIRLLTWVLYNADVADFIVEERRANEAIEEIWKAVHDYKGWDLIRLDNLTSMSPHFMVHHRVCARLFRRARWTLKEGHPFVRVSGSFGEYYQSLRKSKAISDIGRRFQRLQEKGSRVHFEFKTSWDDEVHKQLLELAVGRVEATGHQSFLVDFHYANWLSEIRRTYNNLGYWLVFLLYDDSRDNLPIAYAICFSYADVICYWTVSYNPQYAQYSVGKLLLKYTLEKAWERGARIFDFMAGAEEYKLQWKPEVAFLFGLSFSRSRIKEAWSWTQIFRPATVLKRISLLRGWVSSVRT